MEMKEYNEAENDAIKVYTVKRKLYLQCFVNVKPQRNLLYLCLKTCFKACKETFFLMIVDLLMLQKYFCIKWELRQKFINNKGIVHFF